MKMKRVVKTRAPSTAGFEAAVGDRAVAIDSHDDGVFADRGAPGDGAGGGDGVELRGAHGLHDIAGAEHGLVLPADIDAKHDQTLHV